MSQYMFDSEQKKYWDSNINIRSPINPVVRLFGKQRVSFLKEILGSWVPLNALDVGCGDGFGMEYMRDITPTIWGCDISMKMLQEHPQSQDKLTQCDAYKLPWNDDTFDLVYCWELLHPIAHPEKVVTEMVRVTQKCIIICEPNTQNPAMALFGLLRKEERGLLRFSPGYAFKLLNNSGLRSVRTFVVGNFTPNRTPAYLARLLAHLPYEIPVVGLHTISIGFKN